MKFTFMGFSIQVAKELEINHVDLVILRWFTDFVNTGRMISKVEEGVRYYWVDYSKFIEDYDILNIKKDAVYRRFRKMCEKDILKRMTVKHRGTYSYFAFSKNYDLLVNYKVDYASSQKSQKKYDKPINDVDHRDEIVDMISDENRLDDGVDNRAQIFNEENYIYDIRDIRGREVEDASTPFDMFLAEDDEIKEEPVKEQVVENNELINQKLDIADLRPKIVDQKPRLIDRKPKIIDQKPEQIINLPYKSTIIKNISVETLDEYRLGEILYQNILMNNPRAKKPNFKKWAKTFSLMIRVDHRKAEDIADMIRWVHLPNNFWNSVVLCPNSLRKYYDRLVLKRKLEEPAFARRVNFASLQGGNYSELGYKVFD
ncbi:MAG: hypothetical protein ACI4PU_06945 [Intestinibacter sp.]